MNNQRRWQRVSVLMQTALVALATLTSAYGAAAGDADGADQVTGHMHTAMPSVWIAPDSETPDLLEMFQRPEMWAESRSRIKVFKFGPRQVALGRKPTQNSIDDLARVDAFRKLEAWGIAIAVEAPAIKPWDCTAVHAREMTANSIRSVQAAGGRLRYIAMDEPWTAGMGPCHDTFDDSVEKTASYIKQLSNDPDLAAKGLTPEVGDIETYPAHRPADIERWISELERRGAKPKFFHLDVNVHRLDVDHSFNATRDLRELARFFRGEHIPFGVILWAGYNPVPSDRAFHDLALSWTRRVGQAIGRPDQVIVQSWVVRGGAACSLTDPKCNMTQPHCDLSDGPECGKHSVPLNIPDNDTSAFTLTRTALDALRVLE